ncbi:branched-chain amino acid ABC transporter permease [Paradesulfitobacterium ferrireducens]|uniref:branched-chain amino acid ABC transporter permease n=1 Tax=Paradesulfitobacterium ferrireducens TaxID=2816476 RepID=UPI001A8E7CE3|nr:branched-chain amino acid ABC transporter permease [Paradesulfitobacterium ferrireducens]
MFWQQLVNGLTAGSMYALIALGYTMVYGILKIINFAHGDIFMVGAFLGLIIIKQFHLGFVPAFLLSMVIVAIIGIIIEKIAYRPLRKSTKLAPLLSALGVSIFLVNFAQLVWGTEVRSFPPSLQIDTFQVGSVTLSNIQIYALLISFALMLALHFFVHKTKMGVAMRATSHSINHARLMGINVDNIISLTFGIGSALAAAAGILIGLYYDAVYPVMGYTAGLKAFTAAVLGGIGSIPGAMLGGLLLGVVENLGAAYISMGYRDAIAFGLLIIILLLKPTGLLGKNIQQKV